jgi:hypothetical protein
MLGASAVDWATVASILSVVVTLIKLKQLLDDEE